HQTPPQQKGSLKVVLQEKVKTSLLHLIALVVILVGRLGLLGGLRTMPRNLTAGLSTQLRVNGHCFIFKNLGRNQYESLSADVEPIVFRVDRDVVIGEGSMRRAFKAEVATKSSDGSENISNYLAKIRHNEQCQMAANHAPDALLCKASGLLLKKFKMILSENSWKYSGTLCPLSCSMVMETENCSFSQIPRGDYNNPNEVCFFKAALKAPYVKYCSNIDFNIAASEPELDSQTYRLMNCFTHWSHIQLDL
ncbi:hypothetical protein MJO29_003178, partial [Puccinia striiformis f. sp. tritici]